MGREELGSRVESFGVPVRVRITVLPCMRGGITGKGKIRASKSPWLERGFVFPRNENREPEKRHDFLGLRPNNLTYPKLILCMYI